MKFDGDLSQLQEHVEALGIQGKWLETSGNSHQFRCKDGSILNFWPSTGRVMIQGKSPYKEKLEARVQALLEDGDVGSGAPTAEPRQAHIFVVHGHEKSTRDELELALRRLGLEPYILMNSSGSGLTIIEALEGHIGKDFSSSFGIVLMTPDDMGYALAQGEDKIEPRARQNVVLETGMLLASLTRARMVILVKGHLERPSDLDGIIYLGFNDHIKEVLPKLVTRLREAGLPIDDRKLAEAMA